MVPDDIAVGIPALKAIDHWDSEFNKTDSPFHESAGDNALPGVSLSVRVVGIETIEPPD
jgi:hypothetical protein